MRKISIVVGILNGAACTNSAIQRIDLERGAGSSSSQLLFIARENARSVNRSTESAMRQRYRVETRSVNHDSQVFFATLRALELEMNQLQSQRPRQLQSLDDVNPASSPMLDSTDPGTFVGFPRPPLELPSSTATNIPPI